MTPAIDQPSTNRAPDAQRWHAPWHTLDLRQAKPIHLSSQSSWPPHDYQNTIPPFFLAVSGLQNSMGIYTPPFHLPCCASSPRSCQPDQPALPSQAGGSIWSSDSRPLVRNWARGRLPSSSRGRDCTWRLQPCTASFRMRIRTRRGVRCGNSWTALSSRSAQLPNTWSVTRGHSSQTRHSKPGVSADWAESHATVPWESRAASQLLSDLSEPSKTPIFVRSPSPITVITWGLR